MIILNMYHQPNRSRNSPCRNMLSCRPKGRSAPLACCLPHAGGWKCGQGQATQNAEGPVAGWSLVGLPVAERASPLTALQAAGTKPGAKRRAQIRTAADRGTPMPRCQGGCHLRTIQVWGLEEGSWMSSTNTSLKRSKRDPAAKWAAGSPMISHSKAIRSSDYACRI